jgi:molecular chaperone DnaJ
VPGADLYEQLGVARSATSEDIKKAYRRLARQLHPDANGGDAAAEQRFKEVTRAYEVLRDPERRRRYDTFGDDGAGTGGAGADPFAGSGLGDIFDAFFGGASPFGGGGGRRRGPAGPPRGADLEVVLDIDFEEAVFGAEKDLGVRAPVSCDTCEGSGARPGTTASVCPDCQGAGEIRRVRQSILGQMVTAGPCARCGASGEVVLSPCPDCRGEGRVAGRRTYTVTVPAGVDTGSTLRLSGRGAAGSRGGGMGDVYVHIRVGGHARFERHGYDLVEEVHVPVTQAALGAELDYDTLDGRETLVVPPGTQTGRVFRLRGRGVPRLDGGGRGDLLARVVVDTPTELGPEEEELLRRLAEARGDDVAPRDAGLFSRIRSAFK